MESNSQFPYKIQLQGDKYYFRTISGVEYIAYFIEINRDLYSFSFEPIEEISSYDERISLTIIQIIRDFFKNHRNSMIFVCDISDGLEKSRLRLFNQWFHKYNTDKMVEKIDRIEKLPDYELLASLLVHKQNPEIDNVYSLFQEYIDNVKY